MEALTARGVKYPDAVLPALDPNFMAYEAAIATVLQDIAASMGLHQAAIGKHDINATSGVQAASMGGQLWQG